MLFRSLRPLAGRALAAGAASALALTLFNAAQPSLSARRVHPGTLKTVTISVPIANYDNNQHAENENVRLGNLWDGIETFAAIMTMGH